MMTVKQLAQKHGVSYEAMRKTVDRNREALKGHVATQDRTRYIDEEGIRILEEERRKSKVVVIREDHTDEIAKLKEEVEQLKAQLLAAQGELLKAKDAQLDAQNRIIELQSAAQSTLTMQEDLDRTQKEVDTIRQKAADQKSEDAAIIAQLTREKEAAKQEADTIRKDADEAAAVVAQMTQELTTARQEADQAKAEAGRYERSWFGFYRKR